MSFFDEIIFKPKEKPVALLPPSNWSKAESERNLMFETLFCKRKNVWLSAMRCLECEQRKVSMEEILSLGDGCE